MFMYSYRPSVAHHFKLGPKDIYSLNTNGVVYLSINAYGHDGSWIRPGFDQNAQMVTGFSATEGGSLETPKPSPVYYMALCRLEWVNERSSSSPSLQPACGLA